MELFNIQIEKVEGQWIEAVFHSESHEEAKKMNATLIHWIPIGTCIPCEVFMPDASVAEGIAEDNCKTLCPKDVIQFERFGFARVAQLNKKITAYFAHR